MRKILFISILLTTCGSSYGQMNLQIQSGYSGSVAGATYFPSTQTLVDQKFEASFSFSGWVANNTITYSSIDKVLRQKRITTGEVDKIVADLENDNEISIGTNFLILGLGLKTNIKSHPLVWSLTVSDRLNSRLEIPKQLVQLAWQGNKQFEGQTLDLSKTDIKGLYYREFAIGLATQLASWNNWEFRGGLRLSYYMGLSFIDNSVRNFDFTTATNGSSITVDYNFTYYYSGVEDFRFFDPRGHGAGLNVGGSFIYKDRLQFDLGLTDLGYIKFNKKILTVGGDEQFEFEGLGLDEVFNPTAFLDSLGAVFTPVRDSLNNKSITMPIGTRLSFRTSWQVYRTKKYDRPVNLIFYYSQGFSENPGLNARPRFAMAYHLPIMKHLLIGASASYGGFNDLTIGALFGLKWKHWRFSVQSDDFTGVIFPNLGTGANLGAMAQLLF